MDDRPMKVTTAADITAEIERAAGFHAPFDPATNARLAQLEEKTDTEMSADGTLKSKDMAMQFDMKDPRVRKLIERVLKEQRARAPKHENYSCCHKYCPNFKKCSCFKRTAAEQKRCWEYNWDAKVAVASCHVYGVSMKKLAKDFEPVSFPTETSKPEESK